MTLCREHVKHMSKLEEQALEVEIKSQQDFHRPTFLLQYLIREHIIITPIHSLCQGVPGTGATTCDYFSQVKTHSVLTAKKVESLTRFTGSHVHR